VQLCFWLRSGSFATAVLRELLSDEVDGDDA
jgi:tRNA(Glu) U13 pseudouridine synthase TruD